MHDEAARSKAFPRILLISNVFAPEVGGAGAVAEALARELAEHVVVIAAKHTPSSDGVPDWETYDKRFPFRVHRVESFGKELPAWLPPRIRGPLQFGVNAIWVRPGILFSILRLLKKDRFDIVCLNTLPSYWLPGALRRFRSMKSVFYIHGEEISPGRSPRRMERLQRKALRKADAIVAVSSFTRGLLQGDDVIASKVVVINNGVDTERFTPGPKDPEIEERYGLKGKKVLLCLARLDKRKGQDMLIRSMPQILEKAPNTVLLLVGSGDDLNRLLEIRKELHLEGNVMFAGKASEAELVSYYRTADVYAMPNRTLESGDTEGFGLVFLEAGACGKPVIGGNAGGVPDAIVDGKTGYLVDGCCTSSIAKACICLLLNADLAAEIGNQGLAHSQRNTWGDQAHLFLTLCRTICPPTEVSASEPG